MEHFWVATIGKHDTNDLGETIASDEVDYIGEKNLIRSTRERLRRDQAADDDQTVVIWEVREVARYESKRSVNIKFVPTEETK